MVKSKAKNGTKNALRNIVSSVVYNALNLLLPFVLRTTVVYKIGSEYLGLNSLFTSLLMVLNLSELGFGSALVYNLYKPIAENNDKVICSILNLYRNLYRRIGFFILIIGCFLIPFVPYLIKGNIPDGLNVKIVFFIFLLNTSFSYLFFAHKKALLTAYQRSDILTNISSFITICTNILQIFIIFFFENYYLYVIVFPLFTLVDTLLANYFCNILYPQYICYGNVPHDIKKGLFKQVGGIALQKICSTSRNTFDSIIISIFLGLNSIAIYGNYYYIMWAIHAFTYIIPNSIRAIVGNSVARKSVAENFHEMKSMNFIYLWICGWSSCTLFCLYQPFMELWMGNDMLLPLFTVSLFPLYLMLLSMSDIFELYKDTAGLWWHGRYRVVIEAISNLFLNFILGYYFGLNGILIATIVTFSLLGLIYGGIIVFRYYFKGYSFNKFILKQFLFLIIIILITLSTYWLCSFINCNSPLISLLFKLCLCIVIPNMIMYFIFHNSNDLKLAKLFLSKLKINFKHE